MKKLSLMVVGLLLTVLSYSQDFYRVTRCTRLEYRDTNWVDLEVLRPTELFIIVKNSEIKIGPAKFMTYDDPEVVTYSDHITYSWKCVDSDGVSCFYMMKYFKNDIHIYHIVMYSNGLAWEYETTK